jgi:hypothetical protein
MNSPWATSCGIRGNLVIKPKQPGMIGTDNSGRRKDGLKMSRISGRSFKFGLAVAPILTMDSLLPKRTISASSSAPSLGRIAG